MLRPQRCRRGRGRLRLEIVDGDPCTGRSEGPRGGQAQAATCAGDQRDPACKFVHGLMCRQNGTHEAWLIEFVFALEE